ncbi:MAG TPA: plastocyanin/azurin family copper-binding protein [Vicinamibacterales bacterium]|nr:plastocyanin/azurin family copper-binding protein [Vicinamibacterales bacterium]
MRGSHRVLVVSVTLTLLVGAVALLPLLARSRSDAPREVVLVAREMSFFLDGRDEANPTLRFHPGERVRIVLRNEEPGVIHNFEIPDWRVATRLLNSGQTDAVEFRVPEDHGTQTYLCTPHSTMMRGTIVLE